jgi:hypothetical protein
MDGLTWQFICQSCHNMQDLKMQFLWEQMRNNNAEMLCACSAHAMDLK